MKKLFIMVVVFLVASVVFAQVKTHRYGVGSVTPGKMTKGALAKHIIVKAPLTAAYKRLIPAIKAGHPLRFCIGQFDRPGYVQDFYLIMGTAGLADSITWADTATAKHYNFWILKSDGDTLGSRRTCLAADLGTGASKPRPDSLWFITGTDTSSKKAIEATDRLFCAIDTGGGVPDSLPVNWWVVYKWFPQEGD